MVGIVEATLRWVISQERFVQAWTSNRPESDLFLSGHLREYTYGTYLLPECPITPQRHSRKPFSFLDEITLGIVQNNIRRYLATGLTPII